LRASVEAATLARMRPCPRGVLLALVACLAGCAGATQRIPIVRTATGAGSTTESDVHEALGVWATNFASLVGAAADRIHSESRDRVIRRHAVLWQLRMIPLARLAAFRPDAKGAYVASLAVASAQHDYLATGEGSALFGAHQEIAIEAASKLERDLIDLGDTFLNERQLKRLRGEVDELVAQRPMYGLFSADVLIQGLADPDVRDRFEWVVSLPMTPFRALAGVSDTAQAVQNFNETAREFTEVVNELPQLTRWQLELLLYDAEELEAIERALAAAASMAESAQDLSNTAAELPASLGAELTAQVRHARAAIAELDAALARAEKLAAPLSHVADRVGEASAQWTTLIAELRSDDAEEDGGRPFDVREYESAATRINEASSGVRALVEEINRLDASGARALLNGATWRAAILIAFFFAALGVYRALVSRLR
jgi:hypothetical protein